MNHNEKWAFYSNLELKDKFTYMSSDEKQEFLCEMLFRLLASGSGQHKTGEYYRSFK